MNMDLVILGILNAVLLMLLLVAFKLIRSGSQRDADELETPEIATVADRMDDPARGDEAVIDLRDPAPVDLEVPDVPTMPVYSDPVFAADDTPLPDGAFEAPNRLGVSSMPPEPAPTPPPIGSSMSLTSLSRSAIVIDSSMNGSGPTPSELLFSVIETLGSIGFELTKDSPDYGLLKDADDNTASIDLTKRPNGTDRIAIAVDSPRAVEALAMLEIWHRSRLGATEQVRLSARIR